MNRATPREISLVVLWAVLVMAATAIPYQAARSAAGPDRAFSGFIWGVDDGNVYLSWVRQAAEGRVLLRNPYTTQPQSPHFFSVFLFALGKLCALTGLSPLAAFMGSRYVCGVFCLVAFYLFMTRLTANRLVRAAALVLVSLSSGLGWLVVMMGDNGVIAPGFAAFPMDVADGWQAQPEAIVFSSLLLNPLFAFSLGLVSLTAMQAVRLTSDLGYSSAIWTGILLLILGNVHGYDIFPLHALVLLWLLCGVIARKLSFGQAAARYAVIVALSVASPIWAAYGSKADPSYAQKVNTATLSPRPFDVAVGYGLVLALAVAGAWIVSTSGASDKRRFRTLLAALLTLGALGMVAQQLGVPAETLGLSAFILPVLALVAIAGRRDARNEEWSALVLLAWVSCGAAAMYLPAPFQRKMIEGLHLPLCALAAFPLAAILNPRRNGDGQTGMSYPVKALIAVALLLATIPSNIIFVGECMRHVRANNRTLLHVLAPPVYLSTAEVAGMRWLADHTSERDVVLSSTLTANHIPAHAPCTVVAGHWAETLNFPDYAGKVTSFYIGTDTVASRTAAVASLGADYIWWGPQEKLLQESSPWGPEDPCEELPGMELAYKNTEVRIYSARGNEHGPDG